MVCRSFFDLRMLIKQRKDNNYATDISSWFGDA